MTNSCDPQPLQTLAIRLAEPGQLSADAPLWYAPPQLVRQLQLSDHNQEQEAVLTDDPGVITWLQLRFGGTSSEVRCNVSELRQLAADLPPAAPPASVAL